MTIRRRIWLNLIAVNVCALTMAALMGWYAFRTKRALTWAVQAHAHRDAAIQTSLQAERLARDLAQSLFKNDSPEGCSDALIACKSNLDRFRRAAKAESEYTKGEVGDIGDSTSARIDQIAGVFDTIRSGVLRSQQLVSDGQLNEAIAEYQKTVRPAVTTFSALIGAQIGNEDEEIYENQRQVVRMSAVIAWIVISGTIGLFVLSMLGASAFSPVSRSVVNKIDSLVDATRAISRGDFKHKIEDNSDDELGQLTDHFNEMAEQLQSHRESLEQMQRDKLDASRHTGMAEIATNVLHNVGNVLNSAGVSASVTSDAVRNSKLTELGQVVGLLNEHEDDLVGFLSEQDRGKHLTTFLSQLSACLIGEQKSIASELTSLTESLDHIKSIIAKQQQYARYVGSVEEVSLVDVIEDALKMDGMAANANIQIVREFADVEPVALDRHRLMEILLNLLSNARHAIQAGKPRDPTVTVSLDADESDIRIGVADNGVGIESENLKKVFAFGFTTKPEGHGFGLHGSSLAAKGLGGRLTASSAGRGLGAAFVVEIPREGEEVLT